MEFLPLLRSSAKSLLRRPAYAALVTATLAVGVGGTTAVFSLVNGVLLESIPFDEADRLVTLDVQDANTGHFISLSIPNYHDYRDRGRFFQQFGASAGQGYIRQTDEGAQRLDGRMVLGDFFAMLGVEPAYGRVFGADETEAGAAPLAVLGHGYWEQAFGSDPAVVGSTLVLDGEPHVVVGVLAPGEGFPRPSVEIYTNMGARSDRLPWDDRSSSFGTRAVARLAPGATLQAVQADMNRVTAEVDELEGRPFSRVTLRTLEDLFIGEVRRGLLVLMGAVVLLLAIAGANVANLALARAEGRLGELAVRQALGASRSQVAGPLLAESFCLSVVGGGLGVVLAYAIVGVLPRALPMQLPELVAGQVQVGYTVLLFALAVSLGSGALFGLVPALHAGRGATELTYGSRTTTSRGRGRFRDGLVVAQVGLSVVLLVGAGLLLRSMSALSSVDKGFQAEGVLTSRIRSQPGTFEGREDWLAFNEQLIVRLDASPDVERSAASLLFPLGGRSWELRIWSDEETVEPATGASVLYNVVSPSYFEVLRIPLRRGRTFQSVDVEGAPRVAVIDETMAERYWPGQDPIGRRVSFEMEGDEGDTEPVWRTVVGVVANTRHYELESPSRIQVYVPMAQAGTRSGVTLSALVRTAGDGATAASLLRATIAELQPSLAVSELRMLSEIVEDELSSSRALGAMTGVFSAVASLLACLGIFGVLSLSVARRSREIGVRMAVGASPESVLTMVLGRGMALMAMGAAMGLGASALSGRVLETLLYQVRPWDASVYGAAVAVLAMAALVAVAGPALRAAGTAPSRVLREE